MADKVGYVLKEGNKGDKVSDTLPIYRTPACHPLTILRRSVSEKQAASRAKTIGSYQKVRESAKETLIKNTKANNIANSAISISSLSPEAIVLSATGSVLTSDTSIIESIIERTAKEEYTSIIEDASSASKDGDKLVGGITQNNIKTKVLDVRGPLEKLFESMTDFADNKLSAPMKKATDAMKEKTVDNLAKWFDEMEAIIDALPTMGKLGSEVYKVEYIEKDGSMGWYYTGEHEPMDRVALNKFNHLKETVCAFLTKQTNKVNEKANGMIEEQMEKMGSGGPIMKIINIIKKPPSIGSIIDWAKGIIDIFVNTYKMLFGMYLMAIQMLELIIVRLPQLVNKLLKKITEFDCPCQINIGVRKTTNRPPKK